MKSRRPAVGLEKLGRDADRLDDARRRVLADWCRLVGHRVAGSGPSLQAALDAGGSPAKAPTGDGNADEIRPVSLDQAVADLGLPPRARQVLRALLAGASEKQIAQQLSISPHTVHTYVKQLHKRLNVASRGELLSRFLTPGVVE